MWIGGDSMIHPLLSSTDKTSTTHIGTLLLASSKLFHIIDRLTFFDENNRQAGQCSCCILMC